MERRYRRVAFRHGRFAIGIRRNADVESGTSADSTRVLAGLGCCSSCGWGARDRLRRLREPRFEGDLAESGAVTRNQGSLAEYRPGITRVRVCDDLARSWSELRRCRTSSSRRKGFGPPTSTVPLTGGSNAALHTAAATSSAAIGWKST